MKWRSERRWVSTVNNSDDEETKRRRKRKNQQENVINTDELKKRAAAACWASCEVTGRRTPETRAPAFAEKEKKYVLGLACIFLSLSCDKSNKQQHVISACVYACVCVGTCTWARVHEGVCLLHKWGSLFGLTGLYGWSRDKRQIHLWPVLERRMCGHHFSCYYPTSFSLCSPSSPPSFISLRLQTTYTLTSILKEISFLSRVGFKMWSHVKWTIHHIQYESQTM